MRHLLCGMMIVLAAVGCRKRPARPASSARRLMTQLQAEGILRELPEIQAWSRRIKADSGGRIIPVCQAESGPKENAAEGRGRVWVFYFGQSDKQRTVLWNRFQVDAATGEVGVWDPFKGQFKSLAEWRHQRQLEMGLP